MDPVSLALGITPLVGGTIKIYGALHGRLKLFRHYSRELHRLKKRLDTERRLFLNEIHLLLLAALKDGSLVDGLLEDPRHVGWQSAEFEESLRNVLGSSFLEYGSGIVDICTAIMDMRAEFDCFKFFETNQREGERLKDTMNRLRDAVKITLDKSKMDNALEDLHQSNSDLQQLGEQVRKIQSALPPTQKEGTLKVQLPKEYADFATIRRASRAFHAALSQIWTQDNEVSHNDPIGHQVRFFLDAKASESVCMDLVVICPGGSPPNQYESSFTSFTEAAWTLIDICSSCPSRPFPAKLHVRSQSLTWIDYGLQSPPHSGPDDGSQPKRQRVQFTNNITDKSIDVPNSHDESEIISQPLLKDSFCASLVSYHQEPGQAQNRKCFGYLDSCCNERFRHSLYNCEPDFPYQEKAIAIEQVLAQPVDQACTVVDQLKLARSLVAAVLKFHSTPWLAQYLTVRDISVFRTSQDFTKCLATLHLTASFKATAAAHSTTGRADDNAQDSMLTIIEDARLDHGIRNMTLWCLGAMLLQIGHWSKLESPDDVRAVRRLSYRVPSLGQRYQKLARRCLECDFGYGEDLSRPRLQQAVYEMTYCELSDMIGSLDLDPY